MIGWNYAISSMPLNDSVPLNKAVIPNNVRVINSAFLAVFRYYWGNPCMPVRQDHR